MQVVLASHTTTGRERPVLVWRFARPLLVASTASVGGGVGMRRWFLNAQVPLDYARCDLDAHIGELASALGCSGEGVGLLTAASLEVGSGSEAGVEARATVGVSKPTWAADADDTVSPWRPGTINIVLSMPVRLTEAALLNLLVTTTEAKCQALHEAGVPGTGTASDAVCVVCPPDGRAEPFAGPRSAWGSRAARAVHAAVAARL